MKTATNRNPDGRVNVVLQNGATVCTADSGAVQSVVSAISAVPEIPPRTHGRRKARLAAAQEAVREILTRN